jgi:flagellar hook-associated protein 1 FlgK
MFDGIHIGLSSLQTQKKSIETTGHNIANANNENYSRQRTIQTAKQPNLVPGSDFMMGSGVKVEDIQRIQDQFINQQVREESQESGYWNQIQQGMERIEYIFNEPSDSGLQSAFESFWNSLQDLNSNPNDTATRAAVKNQGLVLAKSFRNINEQMMDYKRALNNDVEKTVSEINSITDRISRYNKQITTALASNNTPNDLLDKREALYNELNELISVKGSVDKVGNLNITVDGKKLVSKFDTNELKISANGTYEDNIAIDINGTEIGVEPDSGEIKGIMDVRDNEIPSYLETLDQIAYNFADEFNEKHRSGFDLDGNTGQNFFTDLGADDEGASRKIEIHSAIEADGGISKIAAGNFSEDSSVVTGEITGTVDTDEYYTAKITDDGSGNFDYEIFKSDGTIAGSGNQAPDTTVDLTGSEGFELTLNGTGETNVNFNKNEGNGNNASSLAEVINQDEVLNDATVQDNYQALISTIGVNAQRADQMKESQGDLVRQLGNIKESISGVSLDEEMANMIKYQQAYNAAAKLITKSDEMLETLIGMVR